MVLLHFVSEEVPAPAKFAMYMVPYLVVGYDILIKAAKGIKNRQAFDEGLLMTIATIGAIAGYTGDEMTIAQGVDDVSVVMTDSVTIAATMEKLYITETIG